MDKKIESINLRKDKLRGNYVKDIKKIKNKFGITEEEFLNVYNPGDYERPSVTVDMLLFTVGDVFYKKVSKRKIPDKCLKILLIKRKDHPHVGQWAIPGGFVEIDESVDDAVYRELKEETNIDNVYMEQLYTWGNVKRDPRMRVISVSYMALVPQDNLKPIAGDDAEEVRWFNIYKDVVYNEEDGTEHCELFLESDDEDRIGILYDIKESYEKKGKTKLKKSEIKSISEYELAFDHFEIINYAIDRLRSKIEYTPIAFNLMPDYFTLTELQKVYETILGKNLITANFRRKMKDLVVAVPFKKEGLAHRPSALYKYIQD